MPPRKRSLLDDQMAWYSAGSTDYRRCWWPWAKTEPNFRDMVRWARANEKDESVIRMMEIVSQGGTL